MNPVFLAAAALLTSGTIATGQVSGTDSTSPPVLLLTADNTEVKQSCTIEIPRGTTLADADGNGVIHIRTSGITVTFQKGSSLWGGPRPDSVPEGPWDTYTGIGIRIDGASDVSIRGARVHGFKVGIWATNCDGLKIEGADLSDNYRQRLKSTPEAEDLADWLYPHRNDKDEWATQHGAGLYIRRAERAHVRNVTVRRGQNGILLNRVNDSRIYDNDCSFLSGWGLGMFRSSRNTVSRNAFDFCVRGHSEGKYNRGQDSAGILIFEQCSNNIIVENSCTHGGDGIFGFAGLEALNGEGAPDGFDFTRRGCNDNLFVGNDLSYAPAHGLEMTFSFGNRIINNRFVENAICGIWGGYSQDTLIARNLFDGNGGMAYGLERGGVNIEHGAGNQIIFNDFENNRCGIHLWWDEHGDFEAKPWGKANYRGVKDNVIGGNTFTLDSGQIFGRIHPDRPLVALQIRDDREQSGITGTVYSGNTAHIDPAVGVELLFPPSVTLADSGESESPVIPKYDAFGSKRPARARALLGRDKIIMSEWGPWDHESPMVRLRSAGTESHIYEVFGAGDDLEVSSGLKPAGADGPTATASLEPAAADDSSTSPRLIRITPSADRNGVFPYRFSIRTRGVVLPITGMIISAAWQLTAFPWDDATDPRKDLDAWRALATGENAFSVMTGAINFDYGHGGPKDQRYAGPLKARAPGADRFGMIARTRLTLGKGRWRITTLSDDGVRVIADGKPILENWTWHAPTRDSGVLELAEEREVELIVEHFEIDGYAVLRLDITPEE
jgi:parallel beta-helix repeat protein